MCTEMFHSFGICTKIKKTYSEGSIRYTQPHEQISANFELIITLPYKHSKWDSSQFQTHMTYS